MRRQLDTYDGKTVRVGDVVYIRATVTKIVRPEELRVCLFSKTTEYEELVRTDLCELELPDLGEEPGNGSIVMCRDPGGVEFVFKRDDAEGLDDLDIRRHDRHWWSYVDQMWVDWPHVVRHGGRNGRILVPAPA